MMHINLIVVGKLKEEYWKEAEQEYLKRLTPFAKMEIMELKEESFSEKDPVEFIKEKEAKKILETLDKIKDAFVIALEEKGKQYDSKQFAVFLNNETMKQCNNVTFVIGGPLGLTREIVQKANATLSLSPLTFTHQMTRVILLEQIYRAQMINGGRRYHY